MDNESLSSPSRAALLAKQIKREWWWVTICLLLLSILLSFYREELNIKRLDLTFYDIQSTHLPIFQSSDFSSPSLNTALIIIDDDSIMRVGYWPWRRIEYARALDYLSQAKAVGLDIFFHDKNPAYPDDDAFLAYALESHGRVVLPSVFNEKTGSDSYMPVPPLNHAAAAIGYINVPPDSDGVVRRAKLYREENTIENNKHFTLALLQAAGDTTTLNHILSQKQGPQRLIPFRGPPGSFDTYSFADVVEGKYSPDTFKDRYVLIGAWSSGLGDFYPTPTSSDEQTSMSGVEILANTLENALDDHWIYSLPNWAIVLLSSLPIVLVCIMLRHLRPRRAIVSTAVILTAVFVGSWILLNLFNMWIPPTVSLIVTVLAYPVWYWRSQEAVLKHINSEISEMRAHDPALRAALENTSKNSSLPERLSHLHKAIELLRQAQQQREETLRFISHDMRSPQNSILALIDMERNQQLNLSTDQLLGHVESYAKTTLTLVDDFINLAKVEAMELTLEPLFLNDLLAEVCDDAWVRAQAKNIKISFAEPEDGVWVNASPQLLKRALANLIDNAIKYSSENTSINCLAVPEPTLNRVTITIMDQGWGIPADALPTIFQVFKRAHAEQQDAPSGSGLGLAFVHAVIVRHFGDISVDSEVSVGTTFTVHLPTVDSEAK